MTGLDIFGIGFMGGIAGGSICAGIVVLWLYYSFKPVWGFLP